MLHEGVPRAGAVRTLEDRGEVGARHLLVEGDHSGDLQVGAGVAGDASTAQTGGA